MAYESELTRFMRDFMAKDPRQVELQKQNRATWWDKPQDLEVSEERAESAVPQPGYVYFSHLPEEDKPA
ncbi:MAG: DUF3460 family protein [Usitatibacter sp.]